jgi:hypothetical protein
MNKKASPNPSKRGEMEKIILKCNSNYGTWKMKTGNPELET